LAVGGAINEIPAFDRAEDGEEEEENRGENGKLKIADKMQRIKNYIHMLWGTANGD